ncbi:Type 1 glutamine amidotransferase-like domain-containing protein [Phenylobacterium sp.]|uniref:Type 1 glutamine amidotransferase-like domain-containing protein n=1 Tax=Phenylobacterium sp. TaxID=1871053 RepID=UPI0030F3B55B
MRLYLSSFRMGDDFDRLVEAVPRGAPVAVIANAVDFIAPEDRLAYARAVFDPVEHFRSFGLGPYDLDLREYFDRSGELEKALTDTRVVWANGGNAFLLMRAMVQSGLDRILRERVAAGTLIYGGWSAGSVVAGPSLRGIELMDDPGVVVDGYVPEPFWDGLGLVDYSIVPHFQSAHAEAQAAARTVAWMTEKGLSFRALRDGEAIIA